MRPFNSRGGRGTDKAEAAQTALASLGGGQQWPANTQSGQALCSEKEQRRRVSQFPKHSMSNRIGAKRNEWRVSRWPIPPRFSSVRDRFEQHACEKAWQIHWAWLHDQTVMNHDERRCFCRDYFGAEHYGYNFVPLLSSLIARSILIKLLPCTTTTAMFCSTCRWSYNPECWRCVAVLLPKLHAATS